MDKTHPLSTPMVVRSLDMKKNPFRPHKDNRELLSLEVPYCSAIGVLMYLANNTRLDITFSVNLLARYSSSPGDIRMKLNTFFIIYKEIRI
jgi:hypothetical protein